MGGLCGGGVVGCLPSQGVMLCQVEAQRRASASSAGDAQQLEAQMVWTATELALTREKYETQSQRVAHLEKQVLYCVRIFHAQQQSMRIFRCLSVAVAPVIMLAPTAPRPIKPGLLCM